MTVDINTVLSGENLVGLINSIKGGVPDDILPPAWTTPNRRISGDSGTYTKVEGTRQTARLVQYGSPSKARGLKGVSKVPVKLIHTFEHQHHDPAVLIKLKNPEQNIFDQGRWEVARQTGEFNRLFANLRISAVCAALTAGKIYFDIDGNLLPTSGGASTTVDYGVPDGNKSQLNVFGAGNIISAKWSAAATNILKQLVNLRKAARKLTGYPITTAFYGASIPDWLAGNTACSALIHGNNRFQEAFAQGDIPDGFGKIKKWIPLTEAFFADKDNAAQDWLADDNIVFAPDPTPDWYEFIEGSFLVPNNINLASDGTAALSNLIERFGKFSYATIETDPPTIKQLAGDTFLPVIKVPKAIFIADVEF